MSQRLGKTMMAVILAVFFLAYGQAATNEKTKKAEKKKEEIQEPKEEPLFKEVIEVVAKRIPEDCFKADRSIAILEKDFLQEQNPRSLPEALYDAPGVFVQQTSAGGGSPIIHGMVGPQVLIVVDGIRFNNSVYRTGPVQYLNLLDPLVMDQIEVLRGPGSVVYGSDAMGGVIHLDTISRVAPADRNQLAFAPNLFARYQTANSGGTYHGGFAMDYKDWSFIGNATYKRFNDLYGGKGVGKQAYSGYADTSAFGKLNRRFSKGVFKDWDLTLCYMYSFIDDACRTDKLYDQNSLGIYDNSDHLVYVRLNALFPSFKTTANVIASYQDFFEQKDNDMVLNDYKTITKTTRDHIDVNTLGLDFSLLTSIKTDVLQLNYGGMVYRDTVGSERFTRVPGADFLKAKAQDYPDNSTYSIYGLYAMVQWDPVRTASGSIFRFSGGWRRHGASAIVPETALLPGVDYSFSGNVFLFSAQYLYQDKYNLSLNFSQGFRAPSLFESVMFGDTGQFFSIPNYDLKPENSNTFEFLARGRFGTLTLSGNTYISFLQGFIKRANTQWDGQTQIGGKNVVFNINAGKGIIWGTEGHAVLAIAANWLLSGDMTYTWGEEKMTIGDDVPLSRIPPLFGQLKIRYDFLERSHWHGFVETYFRAAAKQSRLAANDLTDTRIPKGGTPGWWTWNIRIGSRLWDHVRCTLELDNILNKKYKYHGSGIYNPGTQVLLGVELF